MQPIYSAFVEANFSCDLSTVITAAATHIFSFGVKSVIVKSRRVFLTSYHCIWNQAVIREEPKTFNQTEETNILAMLPFFATSTHEVF